MDHGSVAEPPEGADWSAADAEFMTMMIAHHRQALDMADLASTRADDPGVQALSRSIDTTQGLEIPEMASWLVARDLPEPTVEDVEEMTTMDGMVGMLSPEAMTELADADGPAFDRLFLESMIAHHEGAIAMADVVLAEGIEVRANELATDVSAGQSAEIGRMRDLMAGLEENLR